MYLFRDIASYLLKVADFNLFHLHLASRGVTAVEFRRDLWHQKTRVPGVSYGVVCVILCLAVLVEHPLVTDREMDGQTDRQIDKFCPKGYSSRMKKDAVWLHF